MQASQCGAAGRQFLAVGSQETHAERAQQAGAGIVADSVPKNEFEEVLVKSAILRRALEIAGEGL